MDLESAKRSVMALVPVEMMELMASSPEISPNCRSSGAVAFDRALSRARIAYLAECKKARKKPDDSLLN